MPALSGCDGLTKSSSLRPVLRLPLETLLSVPRAFSYKRRPGFVLPICFFTSLIFLGFELGRQLRRAEAFAV
ncbi:hypothetical protein K1719_042734 [Acacia pycnantha]|nr:hypothetical protein K1719_042734 [Acacia pycnantha]